MTNDRFKYRIYDVENNRYVDNPEDFVPWDLPDGLIAEQCTGLKDRNGKLIFEGDIVFVNGVQESFEVVYAENLCGFGLKHADGLITSVTPSVLGGVEGVGNIHENPELLEGA